MLAGSGGGNATATPPAHAPFLLSMNAFTLAPIPSGSALLAEGAAAPWPSSFSFPGRGFMVEVEFMALAWRSRAAEAVAAPVALLKPGTRRNSGQGGKGKWVAN